jgi:xylose isomerase
MKLDAISAILRRHDLDVKDRLEQHDGEIKGRIDQIATARKIIRENNLDEIIAEKLSQGSERNAIVKELVSQRVCSRATAYRYVTRQSKLLELPIGSR